MQANGTHKRQTHGSMLPTEAWAEPPSPLRARHMRYSWCRSHGPTFPAINHKVDLRRDTQSKSTFWYRQHQVTPVVQSKHWQLDPYPTSHKLPRVTDNSHLDIVWNWRSQKYKEFFSASPNFKSSSILKTMKSTPSSIHQITPQMIPMKIKRHQHANYTIFCSFGVSQELIHRGPKRLKIPSSPSIKPKSHNSKTEVTAKKRRTTTT